MRRMGGMNGKVGLGEGAVDKTGALEPGSLES